MMASLHRLPLELHLLHRPLRTVLSSSCRVLRRSFHASTPTSQEVVRLRFAPSPTGYLHLGGLRTALYNHLLARRLGGTWTLRIEDTDQARYVEGAVEGLMETLKWSGLDFDEGPGKDGGRGPYFQSQRKHIYDRYLQRLLDSGKAYHCFCTPERLADTRKELQKSGSNLTYDRKCLHVEKEEVARRVANGDSSIVRFRSSTDGLVQHDLVYDPITYASLPIEDFVLRKSDGLPTYHFANVVDDHEMGITHVLRGEEWLPSTPKHLALYAALDITPPMFAHMPLLINPDGSKLSKRAGDVRVSDYIKRGYEPEALLNFVAFMGWSPTRSVTAGSEEGDTSEVLTVQQLINSFSIEGINKNRATMSPSKLDFLNRAHLQKKVELSNESGRLDVAQRLKVLLLEQFPESDRLDLNYIARTVAALKERVHTINDVILLGAYFFTSPDLTSKAAETLLKTVSLPIYREALERSLPIIEQLPESAFEEGSSQVIQDALHTLSGTGLLQAPKHLMNPLRHALTGQKVGAGVAPTIGTLGRQISLERIRAALSRL